MPTLDDPARLLALDATELTTSAPEEAFDRLTRLVQRCVRVPVALVSIVDDHRQVFKSQQGLAEPWCSLGETPLSHSFCQHVVTEDAPLWVEDAREHPVVRDNLAVEDLGVIAYLGVPLRTPGGHVIGSLCAIDGRPRAWTPADLETLEALADEAMREIADKERLRAETDRLDSALGRSGALVRALLNALPHVAAVLRPNGTVVAANEAALALAGAPSPAVVGRQIWAVLPLAADGSERLRQAVRDGTPRLGAQLRALGESRLADLTVRAIPEAGGLLLFEARAGA